MSKPSRELIDELRREKIERAKQMGPIDRILAGPDLFDYACWTTMLGIHSQNPGITDAQALNILRERLAKREKREQMEITP